MPELDLGNVKGPQGKSAYQSALDAGYSGSEEAFNTAMAKASDAVLYTAQSLSDAQKAQARGNINAAPGGFGLGQANMEALRDCNNAILSGWYFTDSGTVNTPGENGVSGVLCVSRRFDKRIYQELHVINGAKYSLWSAARVSYGDDSAGLQWGPWEYVNPPMDLGIEYRTTERYLGKPVYVQLMDWGHAPAQGTMKTVAVPSDSENQQLVWAQLTYFNITFPRYKSDGTLSMYIYVASGSNQFEIYSPGEDRSANGDIQALVKYTKKTD